MTETIAVSGKGGTGKTTFCALLIEGLLAAGRKPILAVDADPNSSLGLMLGVTPERSIGDIREEMAEQKVRGATGVPRDALIEQIINESVAESEGLDLLTMGRSEGPGCYCAVNMLLRRYLDGLGRSYRFVVMDNEAGMEHISRRTTKDVDHLFIVSEPTALGLRTAGRIVELAGKLASRIRRTHLVVNKAAGDGLSDELQGVVDGLRADGRWFLPRSPAIEAAAGTGEKVFGEGIALEGMADIVAMLCDGGRG